VLARRQRWLGLRHVEQIRHRWKRPGAPREAPLQVIVVGPEVGRQRPSTAMATGVRGLVRPATGRE
jgi:hypothetical protein